MHIMIGLMSGRRGLGGLRVGILCTYLFVIRVSGAYISNFVSESDDYMRKRLSSLSRIKWVLPLSVVGRVLARVLIKYLRLKITN